MSYSRLPDSKRNEVIERFREGIEDPEYEVIPSKTQKGKFTVRKRKDPIKPAEEQPAAPTEAQPEEEEEIEAPPRAQTPHPRNLKRTQSGFDPNQLFYEYQTQMNRMMIENMKMMRQQVKQQERKRIKNKAKTQKYFDILDSVAREVEAREAPPEQIPEQPADDVVEPVEEEEEPEPVPEPEPEEKAPAFDYQQAVDEMAGYSANTYSRRNRLHTERFGI